MRVGLTPARLIAVLICLLAPLSASTAPIRYAWSGFVEPGDAPGNPWNLAGDGSAVTQNDGTPFTLEILLDQAALDQSADAGRAEFTPDSVTLVIGGSAAVVTAIELSFNDDDPSFVFDSINIQLLAERLSTQLFFSAEARLPISTFALADPAAADLPPTWTATPPIQFGGASGDVLTYPANAPVSAALVPEPSSVALLATGLCALSALRRASARR